MGAGVTVGLIVGVGRGLGVGVTAGVKTVVVLTVVKLVCCCVTVVSGVLLQLDTNIAANTSTKTSSVAIVHMVISYPFCRFRFKIFS